MATETLSTVPLWLTDVDPKTIGVDDQVRTDATPDDELVASVRSMGVLQPPTVYFDAEREKFVVVIGHRRIGAAIAAGLDSIQVLVRDEADAKDALRLEKQLVENERRQGLSPADIARGYKDLSLFGLRPEDIAAAVSEKPERVKAAIKAVASPGATTALDKGIDLEQAALIAEFDDAPDIQASLTKTALDPAASFQANYDRQKRAHEARGIEVKLEQQLDKENCPLVGQSNWAEPYWNGNGVAVPYQQGRSLERLSIEPEKHKKCPGHAAIIEDAANPERITIRYVCTDWKTHHDGASADVSPEEAERLQEIERERAAEREVEAAFAANTAARREWLRGFITGRLNQTAGIFDLIAAATIGAVQHDRNSPHEDDTIAIYILTGETIAQDYRTTPLADTIATGRFTALRALVADALATAEAVTTRPGRAEYSPRLVIQYLDHLANWGYTLTDLDIQIRDAAAAALAAETATEEEA